MGEQEATELGQDGPWVLGPDADGVTLRIDPGQGRAERVDPERSSAAGDPVGLSCDGARIEAGRVNAHTHLYSGLAALGMPAPEPPPQTFVQILERVWWRLDRALDADALRASAELYVAEALLAGTTTLVDHHESPAFIEGSLDVLWEVCEALGVRVLLGYGATERNGGREEGRRGLAECRRMLERPPHPRRRTAVALHASFTVSDDTVREAAALCHELGAIMHVHVAEDGAHAADDHDARARGYEGPLERLLALDALPPGSIVAHGLALTVEQVRKVNDAGAWIVQNPRSNHGNAVGYPMALAHGDRVALGTDGYPARMEDEVEALYAHARAHGDDLTTVARRVTAGHALVAERFGGSFTLPQAVGDHATADLRVVEPDGRVRHTVVAGRLVVRDGVLVAAGPAVDRAMDRAMDLAAIRQRAQVQAERLWARMAAL